MTLNTLYDEVRALGFEDGGTPDGAFVFAANRALLQIAAECKEKRRGTVYAAAYPKTLISELYAHTGEPMSFSLVGKCFCFVSNGSGSCEVTDKSGVRKIAFSAPGQVSGGFIDGSADITFMGDNAYTVYDLVAYGVRVTDKDGRLVPYSKRRAYVLYDYIPDLLTVCAPPTDARGAVIADAAVTGGELLLPSDFSGKVYIDYVRRPQKICIDTPDEPIDLPEHLTVLLPLLVAAYVWLDDDGEKATYYMSLYRDAAAGMRIGLHSSLDTEHVLGNGWA